MKKRKKGVFIAVAGAQQEFDTILTKVKGFFDWANIELVKMILYPNDSNELGGVRKNEKRMTQAFEVGVRISKQKSVTSQS